MTGLDLAAFVELLACWILWGLPFFFRSRKQPKDREAVTAPAAKWGIGVQAIAFFLAWFRIVRSNPPGLLIASMLIAPASTWFVWRAVTHLGKQWRIQAGVYSDHELVRTGPYAVVRHPIYTSMLGMLIATGLVMTWWPVLIVAAAIFIVGMEIRIRAEEALLESRFGETFRQYRASVPAYIPFIR
ncbi:MAG: isoprenylcysteine carboxylmethyltransferase family protein [Acidobacteriia bacterium]|nr:isoprenylcysteine carboxylmethyltransferase family protein [Terriglobia bacterium]